MKTKLLCIALIMLTSTVIYAAVPRQISYPLNETTLTAGSTITDIGGGGIASNLAVVGTGLTSVTGKTDYGNAVNYPAGNTTSYITGGYTNTNLTSFPISMGVWVKSTGSRAATGSLFMLGNSSSTNRSGMGIELLATGTIQVLVRRNDTQYFFKTTSTTLLSDNNWHYILTVINSTTDAQVYVDNILVEAPNTLSGTATTSFPSFGNLSIGGWKKAGTLTEPVENVVIDEPILIGKALNAFERTALYTSNSLLAFKTLTYTINGNGSLNFPSGSPFAVGDAVSVLATPNPSLTFIKWEGDITGTNNPQTITIANDLNFTVTFSDYVASIMNNSIETVNTFKVQNGCLIVPESIHIDDVEVFTVSGTKVSFSNLNKNTLYLVRYLQNGKVFTEKTVGK